MATLRHGLQTRVFLDKYELTDWLRGATKMSDRDIAEAPPFHADAKVKKGGVVDEKMSFAGMFDGDVDAIADILDGIITADDQHVLTLYPEDSLDVTAGHVSRHAYLASVKEAKVNVEAVSTEIVKVDAEMAGDGRILGGDSLHDFSTALAAAGTGSSPYIDTAPVTPFQTLFGGIGHLHVVTNTLSGNLVVKVQHSSDHVSWVDLITFATVSTGVTKVERAAGVTDTILQYVRGTWTAAAGTGSAKFALAFGRNTR